MAHLGHEGLYFYAYPGLTAFIYFDAVGSAGYDYRPGPAGFTAFKAIGQ